MVLSPNAGPIAPEERIATLDILRGFALLGILIINTQGFKAPSAGWRLDGPRFPGPLDRLVDWAVDAFGSGKFNAIFSFLFGVGLTIQVERAEARGASFVRPYLRRLAVLLALGLAHGLLLWDGDVLHVYAVLGLALVPLRRVPDRVLFALVVALLLVPVGLAAYRAQHPGPPEHPQSYWQAKAAEQVETFGRGSYPAMVRARLAAHRKAYVEDGWGYQFFGQMGVTMLLGFVAGRRRIFQDLPEHLPLVRRVFRFALPAGLVCALAYASAVALGGDDDEPTAAGVLVAVAYELNRPLLSLAYIAGLTLLSVDPAWRSRLGPLASVGRMPLTNYLMQSVIVTTIFYGYGLGWFGRVGPALALAIDLPIYAAQVAYSHWWMARFRFGPLEWLWRAATYGRWPELRPRRAPDALP